MNTVIAISGAHGLIGSNLRDFLIQKGYIIREISKEDLMQGQFKKEHFEGLEAVIHLAGSPIAKRWTRKRKEEIFASRVESTKNIAFFLSKLSHPPKVFISASAVGYYGDTQDRIIDEEGDKGKSFLASVCDAWEKATGILENSKVRVVYIRFGAVLSSKGGMLKRILPLFKWKVGGSLGKGQQYISWITLDDVLRSILHVLHHEEIRGAVNVTSPSPISNKVFTEVLCRQLGCIVGPSLPGFIVKIFLGEMAEELLLSSSRIVPRKLLDSGYLFKYPEIEEALAHICQETL
jgi:uncharacterized protein (TIGR01777 family)